MSYRLSLLTQDKQQVHLQRISHHFPDRFISLTCPFHSEPEGAEVFCGEWCPFFEISEYIQDKTRVTISCSHCIKTVAVQTPTSKPEDWWKTLEED